MVPRTLAKNVQVVMLAVIVFITVLKTTECGKCHRYIKTNELFTDRDTYVASPNFPNPYPNNFYCTWEIESPKNCTLKLRIFTFDLESSANCSKDYVALYDGKTTEHPLLGKFCDANHVPGSIRSTGRIILLEFRSDGSGSKNGFEIEIRTGCRYSITPNNFKYRAKVSSPNYPYSYPVKYYGEWIFETTPNCTIKLRFESFDLEQSRFSYCALDYVALHDWTTRGPMLGKFCGNETPPAITSKTHKMVMIFESTWLDNFPGFEAIYTTECFHFVSSKNIIVTSPNYPEEYTHEYEGVWKFETSPDYRIKIVFDSFKVEPGKTAGICDNDYVKLFDGDSEISENQIGVFCGSGVPHVILSTAHKIFMVFRSDSFVALEGFRATISKVLNLKNFTTDETERNLTQYFLNTRQRTLSINNWGTDITRTAVALFLNDRRFFAPGNKTGEEIAYELSLQLMSKLVLKKRISTKDLALFINALTVACINPKNFFGFNLVAELRKRIDTSSHTNAFFMLALCNGGEYMKMEDVDKLQQLFSANLKSSSTEIQALVVMALKCISKQSDRNLTTILDEMALELKEKQQYNGTVDNLKNTALVVQALIATESYETDFYINLAIQSMLKELNHTHVGAEELFYVLPIFKWNTLLDINSNHCTNTIKTDFEEMTKVREDPDERIQVHISMIIGDDMDFSQTWRMKVPPNFSFYQVLENISSTEPNYKFRYIMSDEKPYVAGLANFEDRSTDDSFWFIYTKPLSSADNPILLQQSPVDIQVNETHEFILWYRSEPLPSTQEDSSDDSS